ncbi:IBR domain, Zinc finger, RING/FYVE/PHD-type, E3 ubiquitin ligase RBR family [Artemisia annua]|uniref:RBR-type E3 ubiquitin transferase n=1 Tax=Artemisia annua TaxID=35608 RepID=A0A2U1QCE4_ARTAN|nr:IBR domain, Zinc finger, RING/FYVE/PHD-type, E3 ubiquitin ligase RBR family [Artemisia annua]PWA95676.1 IBR domain, Zinc finger, RING/FYVE/PHD-type, E3 ubiquitin ligase RBR family [Artemisia annua]
MGNTIPKPQQNPPIELDDHDPNFTCEICIEPVTLPNKRFENSNLCSHPFCTDCMIKYIQVKLDDNVADIKCPSLSCENSLDPLSCRNKVAREVFTKWCDVLLEKTLLGFDRVYCPNRECSVLVVNECGGGGSGGLKRCVCPNCKKAFCFRCKVAWHSGFRCEESGEMRDGNDVAFGVLSEREKWMRCPVCRHCVELVRGCAIVRCRCGIEFCYKCGKKVDRHWCNCRRSSTCCMWLFHICIVILVLWPFFLLFTAITKRSQH